MSKIDLLNSEFSRLEGTNGACINSQNSVANISNCTFHDIEAYDAGGVLYAANSKIDMSQCKLSNAKSDEGAALTLYSDSEIDVTDSSFYNCTES